MFVAPQAELDDGLLDVVATGHVPQARVPARAAQGTSRARTSTSPSVHVLRGSDIEIDADRPFEIYADGDPIGTTPGHGHASRPRCLRVIVPG